MSPATPPPAAVEHDALAAGTRFGEFEIRRVHGVGGFGIVYLAWDHSLEREVALKEYMPATLASRGAGEKITVRSASYAETFAIGLRSFMNEARLLARFDHPSLVKVYRFWEDNATAYMVMPFLRGTTLRDTRRRMSHPPDEAWIRSVVLPILSALELLHREGVYHRDIAPDNILLPPDGPPILLDFGAARRVINDRTQSLTAILKPSYAPIEQYAEMAQLRQGPWTDLYALGAVVHYLLFGAPPAPATARAVQDETDAIEQRVAPGVSPRFMRTVAWMLAVRPNQRPQNAEALRAVLEGRAEPPLPGTVTVAPTRPPIAGPAIEPQSGFDASTGVQPPAPPISDRTAGLAPGADPRTGGATGLGRPPVAGATPLPAAPATRPPGTLPPNERTSGLASTLAGSGSFSPRSPTPMSQQRTLPPEVDADATRIEGASGFPGSTAPRPSAPPVARDPGTRAPTAWTQAPGAAPPSTTGSATGIPWPAGATRPPGTTQPPAGATRPPDATRPPVAAGRPSGATQPPAGLARPPGITQPPDATRPPGVTVPPSARTQPPPSGFGHATAAPSTPRQARSSAPWIAGTAAALVAAVAFGAWFAGRHGADAATADAAASATAAASGPAAASAVAVPADAASRPPESAFATASGPAAAAVLNPTSTTASTAPIAPVVATPSTASASATAQAADAASASRVRAPRAASATVPALPADAGASAGGSMATTGPAGAGPRADAASGASALDRARAAQAAASARDAARSPAPPPVPVPEVGPQTLAEACGSRQFIAKYRCEEERCEEPRFRNSAVCEPILVRKRQRENR